MSRQNRRAFFNILGSFLIHLHNEPYYYWGNLSIYVMSYAAHQQTDSNDPSASDHNVVIRPALALTIFEPSWLIAMMLGGFLTSPQGCLRPKPLLSFAVLLQNVSFVVCYFLIDVSPTATFTIFGLLTGLGCGFYEGVLVQNYVVNQSKKHTALLTSVVLAGGPTGGVFIVQFVTAYTNPENLSLSSLFGETQVFQQKEILDNVPFMLLILAGCLAGVQLIGLCLLTDVDGNLEANHQDNHNGLASKETNPLSPSVHMSKLTNTDSGDINFSGENGTDICGESFEENDNTLRKNDNSISAPQRNYMSIDTERISTSNREQRVELENVKSETHGRTVVIGTQQQDTKTPGSIRIEQQELVDDSYSPRELLQCASFYKLAAVYMLGITARAVVSTYYKIYGQIWIKDDHFLTLLGTVQAICTIPSSLAWGMAMDYVSVKVTLMFMYSSIAVTLLSMYFTAQWNRWAYFVATICATMSTNVYVAFSVATVTWFGRSHYAINMAVVESSAILGIVVTSSILDALIDKYGHFTEFFLSSCSCVVGLYVIAFLLPYKLKKH